MEGFWAVRSVQLNVDSGDSGIHHLIADASPSKVHKSILIDGGTGAKGSEAIVNYLNHLLAQSVFTRVDNQPIYKFDSIVATHWDSDHYKGISKILSEDLHRQIKDKKYKTALEIFNAAECGELQSSYTCYAALENKPGTSRPVSSFFAPYWYSWLSNTGPIGNTPYNYPGQPFQYLTKEDKVYVGMMVFLGEEHVANVPIAIMITGANAVGLDLFTSNRVVDTKLCTSPVYASARLSQRTDLPGAPAMLCVACDSNFLDPDHVQTRGQMHWATGRDETNKVFIARLSMNTTTQKASAKDLNLSQKVSEGPSALSVGGHTTGNNQCSLACMLVWPNPTVAHVSAYYGGDMGEENEEHVLRWSLIPNDPNDPTSDRSNVGFQIPAMKLSHHGAW
jgi:hypothetical protein